MKKQLIIIFIFILDFLFPKWVLIANFDNYLKTDYGNGEIALTYDAQESTPGNSTATLNLDNTIDHTSGSGKSLKLTYSVDSYVGFYINMTSNTNVVPYFNMLSNDATSLHFWIKSDNQTDVWVVKIIDSNNNNFVYNIGEISLDWKEISISDFSGLDKEAIKTIVFLNTNSSSTGSIWVDDISFKSSIDYVFNESNNKILKQLSISDMVLNKYTQSTTITISTTTEYKIYLNIYNSIGKEVNKFSTGDFYYSSNDIFSYTWYGVSDKKEYLDNDIYFVKIVLVSKTDKETYLKTIAIKK